jgi:hypothetical protein
MSRQELITYIKKHNKRYEKEDLSGFTTLQLNAIKNIIDMKKTLSDTGKKLKAQKK